MKIESFLKRLNATEIGEGVTNDTYIAIPREVDLSQMLENQQAMTIFDRVEGLLYTPENANIRYVQTGQNKQERIAGLGPYFRRVNAAVGDEIVIEKVEDGDARAFYLDFNHRDVIVFQINKDWVEILTPKRMESFKTDPDYFVDVVYRHARVNLCVQYLGQKKKKRTSPADTAAYDLLIDGKSILPGYEYLDYLEISGGESGRRLARMKTYLYSRIDTMDGGGDKK